MASALDYALALVKKWEGCELEAYPDPGTGAEPWTIGYGATGPGIAKAVKWTQQQADDRLALDVKTFMLGVNRAINRPVLPHQLGAMTSLAYNIGLRAFSQSTLLSLFNQGDIKGASEQFLRWNKAGGRVMRGLSNRRADERDVFDGENLADFSNVRSGVASTEDRI